MITMCLAAIGISACDGKVEYVDPGKGKDACVLLKTDEVEQVLGEPVSDAKHGEEFESDCRWIALSGGVPAGSDTSPLYVGVEVRYAESSELSHIMLRNVGQVASSRLNP